MADYPYGLTLDEMADDSVLNEAERCYGPHWTERDRLVAAIGAISHTVTEGYRPETQRWAVAFGHLLRDENAYRAAREHREARRATAVDALMAKASR